MLIKVDELTLPAAEDTPVLLTTTEPIVTLKSALYIYTFIHHNW